MRSFGLVTKSLMITLGLFAVTILVVASFVAWGIDKTLTVEFQSRGKAIAESIAGASVEILLNEDPATLQAMIDQQKDGTPGISYILVMDEKGDVISHTFTPIVPDDVRGLPGDPHRMRELTRWPRRFAHESTPQANGACDSFPSAHSTHEPVFFQARC